MAQFPNMYPVDLSDGHAAVVSLNQMYLGNAYANRVGAIVTNQGENVDLGGSCAGTAVLGDGSTVALTGTVSGNEIYCDLPSGAYAADGPIEVFITWVSGENKTTLLAGFGNVRRTETGTYIDPGTVISDVAALIESINTAVASIPSDYSALLHTLAPDFSASTAYSAGDYAWYNGTLYHFTANHAAGSWTGTDAAVAVIGNDLGDLKSATIPVLPAEFGGVAGDGSLVPVQTRCRIIIDNPQEYVKYRFDNPATITVYNILQKINGTWGSNLGGFDGSHTINAASNVESIAIIFRNAESASNNITAEEVAATKAYPAVKIPAADLSIKLKNLIKNGNASYGLNGDWFTIAATMIQSGNYFAVTATQQNGGITQAAISLKKDHKYYVGAKYKYGVGSRIRIYLENSASPYTSYGFVENVATTDNSKISSVITVTETVSTGAFRIRDVSSNYFNRFDVTSIILIDLTEDLGAGNDSSPALIESILNEFDNGWFEGTAYAPKITVQTMLATSGILNGRYVNVYDYGAVGDGVADDTAAIAAAVAAVPVNGTLLFSAGTYLVSNVMLKSNMNVEGFGQRSIIKLKNAATSGNYRNCLSCVSISNVTISDICLDGNRTNNSTTGASQDQNYNGIFITRSNGIKIRNVLSKSNGFHGCIMTYSEKIVIENSEFTDNGYRPFHGHSTLHNAIFSGNYCHDNGKGFTGEANGPYDGIFFFSDVENVTITKNRVITANSVGCIVIGGKGPEEVGTKNVSVIGNILEAGNTSTDGIVLIGSEVTNLLISGNAITSCRFGIYSDGQWPIGNGIVIVGNTISDCESGVFLFGKVEDSTISENTISECSQKGMRLENLIGSVISGNSIAEVGSSAEAIYLLNCTDDIVTGNSIRNAGSAVSEGAGSDYNFVTSNIAKGVTTGVALQGTHSAANNNFVNRALVS